MPFAAYPSNLENKTWQKAKSALAGKTGIGDKLEELKKAHDGIKPTAFQPTNGLASKKDIDDWKKTVNPEVTKAEKLQKLLVAFSQFANSKSSELKKDKLCPSKVRETVDKMSATAKKLAVDIGLCVSEVSAQLKAAENALTDDDDDAPDADLLAQLKASKTNQRNFVIALGKVPGLVLTKSGLSGAHRQEAKEIAGGGGKLVEGNVIVENSIYVFVLPDKPPGGLARSIKKAISLQTATNVKVKVRGGGVDVDDDADIEPPPGYTDPTPGGLSPNQEKLYKLAINHGPMDRGAAEKMLADMPNGSWLLRFAASQNQNMASRKAADGKFEHFISMPPGKDLDLPSMVKAFQLDAGKVVRPGDKPLQPTDPLKIPLAKVQQILDLCDKGLTTMGKEFVAELTAIQANLKKTQAKTDPAKVMADFEIAKQQYLDALNRSKKAKKSTAKTEVKQGIILEKSAYAQKLTPSDLVKEPRYVAKVANDYGISDEEAQEVLDGIMDELLEETRAILPDGFKTPKGKRNTINPVLAEVTRPKLTLDEANALNAYTGEHFLSINPPLWKGNIPSPPYDKTHQVMQEAFAKAKPFEVPLKVTRGLNFDAGAATDDFLKPFLDAAGQDTLVPLNGYISTGTSGTPGGFKGNIELVIVAKQGLDLLPYSDSPYEKELLLNHNTPVKVYSCKQSGGKWTVILEQILPVEG